MSINKKIFFLTLLGLLSFYNLDVKEKNLEPLKIESYKMDALQIERLQAINILQSDEGQSEIFNKIQSDNTFINLKDSLTKKSRNELKELITKYENINLTNKEYTSRGIYEKFIEGNKKINREEASLNKYEICKVGEKFYLKNERAYKLENGLEKTLENLLTLKKFEKFSFNSKDPLERLVSLTTINLSEYIPFISEVSKKEGQNLDEILSIISKESFGYPYVVGRTGDLNLFQLNPSKLSSFYSELWKSGGDFFKDYFEGVDEKEFERRVKFNPKSNIVAGISLIKKYKEEGKNEPERVLIYHLGECSYSKIPYWIRKKIREGKVISSEKLPKSFLSEKKIYYLKDYFERKEALERIKNHLRKDSFSDLKK